MGEGHHNAALDFQAIFNGSEILFVKNPASTGFASRIHFSHNTQCGNDGNLLPHFFDKNFVKSIFLMKKLWKTWFHEFFFSGRVNFPVFHTVLQHQQLDLMFLCSFHECDCRLQILWYVTSKSSKWRENWLVVFPEKLFV